MPAGETGSGDVTVEIGITATPVIDLPNKFLYLVAKSKQTIGGNTDHYVQTLYKVDIGSGAVVNSTVIGDTRYNGGNYVYNTAGAAANTPYAVGTGDGATTVAGQSRVYFNGNARVRPRRAAVVQRLRSTWASPATATTARTTAGCWRTTPPACPSPAR